MTDDLHRDPADPGEPTQRTELPLETPAVPAPATPAAPVTPAPAVPAATTAAESYSPTPEARPDWIAHVRRPAGHADPGALVRAARPSRPRRVAVAPTTVAADRRSGPRRVALLSAVLASGGTVLALGATGALDRTLPGADHPAAGTSVGAVKPVTIDENSATIDVAAAVSPAVVRITVTGNVEQRRPGRHPRDRRRLGRHLRQQRLDPHQPPRRRGQRQARRSSSRTAASSRARSTASTR